MNLLLLFVEFFRTGLFSVGGGLATIPFLQDMGARTGWFDAAELANMIAVSESTPGPLGINMASYVGFTVAGPLGCLVATLGEITPSILVILLIARFLQKFRTNRIVDGIFYGLRPASAALVAAALLEVAATALLTGAAWTGWKAVFSFIRWEAVVLFAVIFLLIRFTPLKKLHPIVFIAASAVVGVLLQL